MGNRIAQLMGLFDEFTGKLTGVFTGETVGNNLQIPAVADTYGSLYAGGAQALLLRNVVTPGYRLGYARNLPREAAPTIVVSGTALGSSQTLDGCNQGTGLPNFKWFGFYGAGKNTLAPRSSAVTQNRVVTACRSSADTLGQPPFTVSFYLTSYGNSFDILFYKDNLSDVCLFVDGIYCGRIAASLRRATAQAGSTTTTMVLDTGSSATDNFYKQCYLRIISGTGTAGEVRQITGYVGASKAATVSPAWSVTPDATTVFAVDDSPTPSIDSGGATIQYINVTFPTASPIQPVTRLIQIAGKQFMGVNIGQNDAVTPGPPLINGPTMIFLGDSFMDGTRGPDPGLHPVYEMGFQLGVQPISPSSGGTGWWTRGPNNRLNFLNRAVPPTEAWNMYPPSALGYTGGTFNLLVTYNGVTSIASGLAYNISVSALETALNALTFGSFSASAGVSYVGPTGQGCFCVARGDLNTPFIIVANGMVGATLAFDATSLTGPGSGLAITNWPGDIALNMPVDANGKALPFFLYMQGSGNDSAASGYSDALLQANAITIAKGIVSRFPTCIPFFGGIVTVSDGTGSNGIITATDYAHNQAIAAGAAYLPKMHGQVPFIDTYKEGVGGEAYFTGSGNVGSPTNAKRDIMKSLLVSGHPTGQGKSYWTSRDTREMHRLLAGFLA